METNKSQLLLTRILFVLVIAACGTGAYFFFKKPPPEAPDAGDGLEIGKRYRVFVRSLILPPTKEDGSKWDDDGKHESPDVFFRVYSRENMVYESSTIDDVLVAEFFPVKLGILNLLRIENPAEYLEAFTVENIDAETTFKIEVIDKDPFKNDEMGSVVITLKDLQLGSNRVENDGLTYVMTVLDADADINKALKDLGLTK
jgi:hypothetical protein